MKKGSAQPPKREGSGDEREGQRNAWESLNLPIPFFTSSEELDAVFSELSTQTPRGCAVLGASFLEWRIRQMIKHRLCIADKQADRLLGTDSTKGELDFSSQCKLAYCLGLVGPIGLKDLENIAVIRNRFAHRVDIRDFAQDQGVRQRCQNLQSPKVAEERLGPSKLFRSMDDKTDENLSLRNRYVFTVHFLYIMPWAVALRCPVQWPRIRIVEDDSAEGIELDKGFPFW